MQNSINDKHEEFMKVWLPAGASTEEKIIISRAFYVGASESYKLLMEATSGKKPKAAIKNMDVLRADIKSGIRIMTNV